MRRKMFLSIYYNVILHLIYIILAPEQIICQALNKSVTLDSIGRPDVVPRGSGCTLPEGGCDPTYKYRSYEGTCNNLKHPLWGSWRTPYGRLLSPRYADGISMPPIMAENGELLPSTRIISQILYPEKNVNDQLRNIGFTLWGQFLVHDLSFTLLDVNHMSIAEECCGKDGKFGPLYGKNPDCFPIIIPRDDPIFRGDQCMNFVRCVTDIDTGCNPGNKPAQQISANSHFIDLSHVYGPSKIAAEGIREYKKGRLSGGHVGPDRLLYPLNQPNVTRFCELKRKDEPCYFFPDVRGIENPWLTSFGLLIMREHNRIAAILSILNTHWDDERLYQEARNIVIGEFQFITFYEYFPLVLGRDLMIKNRLIIEDGLYFDDYDDDINPSILNEFAHSVFRHQHNAIQGEFYIADEHRKPLKRYHLFDNFNRPVLVKDNFDNLLRGMCSQSTDDHHIFTTTEVTDFLFPAKTRDLIALDKQRERDCGLPSYNDFRVLANLPRANKMEDFADVIDKRDIKKIRTVYGNNPNDVELGVGGTYERDIPGTMNGPTFTAIIIEQIKRIRRGDSFFFEHLHGNRHPFTKRQLNEIKKASVARLVCDNADHITFMQKRAFQIISEDNPLWYCDDVDQIPVINLKAWKEKI